MDKTGLESSICSKNMEKVLDFESVFLYCLDTALSCVLQQHSVNAIAYPTQKIPETGYKKDFSRKSKK